MNDLTFLQFTVLETLKRIYPKEASPKEIELIAKSVYNAYIPSNISSAPLKKLEKLLLIKRNILNPKMNAANRRSTYCFIGK